MDINFTRKSPDGVWIIRKRVGHSQKCVHEIQMQTQQTWSSKLHCVIVYTGNQTMQCILPCVYENVDISVMEMYRVVQARGIYTRMLSLRRFRAVSQELTIEMSRSRNIQMACVKGYMKLLLDLGHSVDLYTITGKRMKDIRIQAAHFIFYQEKWSGRLEGVEFDVKTVNVSDIDDEAQYYSYFQFIPNISERICSNGRNVKAADAAHCKGAGTQSFGTTFEDIGYENNYNLCPLYFSHYVGSENSYIWTKVFDAVSKIGGFDVDGRVTIVDQEKNTDSSFK